MKNKKPKQNPYKEEIDRYLKITNTTKKGSSNTIERNKKIRKLELKLKNKLEELQQKDDKNPKIKSIKKYLIELNSRKDLAYYFPEPEI